MVHYLAPLSFKVFDQQSWPDTKGLQKNGLLHIINKLLSNPSSPLPPANDQAGIIKITINVFKSEV
jgi:hypothetical protein